jgi:hypothetical protein
MISLVLSDHRLAHNSMFLVVVQVGGTKPVLYKRISDDAEKSPRDFVRAVNAVFNIPLSSAFCKPTTESCVCKGKYLGLIAECTGCRVHFHLKCMCIKETNFVADKFVCPWCIANRFDPTVRIVAHCRFGIVHNYYSHGIYFNYYFEESLLKNGNHVRLLCVDLMNPLRKLHQYPANSEFVVNSVSVIPLSSPASRSGVYIENYMKVGHNIFYATPPVSSENENVWVFILQVVKPRAMLSRLSMSESVEFVKKLFDPLDGVEVLSVRMSTKCPVSLMRMKIPARGKECKHTTCFDLDTFVAIISTRSINRNQYTCPICAVPMRAGLVIDSFVETVLEETELICDEVTLRPDGTWLPIKSYADAEMVDD